MADRPWVTPQEVRDYSENPTVQTRTDSRIEVDIARAEQYVITYTHNTFADEETIPEPVKTAVIILAEAYGHNAVIAAKDVKSETFDDYSYTTETTRTEISALDLGALLDEYVLEKTQSDITIKLRKL